MKKVFTLCVAIMASAATFAQTTLLWNGENYNVGNKGDFWDRCSQKVVENPDKNGINTSGKCLEFKITGNETSCNYAVSGNMFSGRTLELSTSTAANKVKLKSGSEVKPELKVDKDFKADKKITGSWTYDNGYAKMTYKFNDDGTVQINQSDALNVDGTYLIKNGTIIIKYYYTDEVEMDVAYSVESNGLKLNDILYTKDDGSAKATTAAVTEAATETATTSAK